MQYSEREVLSISIKFPHGFTHFPLPAARGRYATLVWGTRMALLFRQSSDATLALYARMSDPSGSSSAIEDSQQLSNGIADSRRQLTVVAGSECICDALHYIAIATTAF